MADYRLSSRADTDLAGIADYTLETFGIEQTRQKQMENNTDTTSLQKSGPVASTESCGNIEGYDLAPSKLFQLLP
ncbi:type II toxin-antitoxin system RelE/ParE family toxin [candidate division KSB1 bacterium]|nr:type II toxin-antitoxin system RelE/ParE family toxin [candidate division KSB1 bacterium]